MSDSESDMSGIEEVVVQPPTAPKPKTKKKTQKTKTSDAKAAQKAREKRQKALEKNDLSANDSDNDSDTNENKVLSEILVRLDNLELKNTQLQKEIDELKAHNENLAQVYSGKKLTKGKAKPKVKKTLNLSHMTARDVQTLVESERCWGDYDKPEDHKEASKLFSKKPKLPSDIRNEKLREFVENALANEDLMDQLDITLIDEKIKTHDATKIIKNHCKENDSIIIEEETKDDGKTTKRPYFNLTEGDFEDMFEEQVSSD